jgi:hypothetical protein
MTYEEETGLHRPIGPPGNAPRAGSGLKKMSNVIFMNRYNFFPKATILETKDDKQGPILISSARQKHSTPRAFLGEKRGWCIRYRDVVLTSRKQIDE